MLCLPVPTRFLAPKWIAQRKGLPLPATDQEQTNYQSNQNNKAMHSLKRKVALITGSGRGKAIVERFARLGAYNVLTPA